MLREPAEGTACADPRPAPPALVEENGRVVEGVFEGACPRANLEEAPLLWAGCRMPATLARLRFKQWQHFACVLEEAFLGVAVVDLGWMRTSWCHLRDRRSGETVEHSRRGCGLDLHVAAELWNDRSWARDRGLLVEIESALTAGEHRLSVAAGRDHDRPGISARLIGRERAGGRPPLVVCMPVGAGRHMYSHKALLPLEGEISVGDRVLRAEPASSYALLDVHKAYYPWHTTWEWATFGGRDAAGRRVGMNLTRNTNRQDDRLNENALWLANRIQHLGPARFEHDRAHPMRPWRLRTDDDGVDLVFTPEASRSERLQLGLIASVFHQLQGEFRGSVRFGAETVRIDRLFGLCEDHDSRW